MRTKLIAKKIVAINLVMTMILSPLLAMAQDEITEAGFEGQNFAKQIGLEAKNNSTKVENGQMSVPTKDENGNFQYESDNSFSVDSLYPGTSSSNSDSYAEYFSDGAAPDVDDLGDLHDSEGSMSDVGDSTKDSLWEDANSDNPSISGAAYKVLLDTADLSKPDFTNDPVLNLTKSTYENIDVIAEGFGDCSTNTTFDEITMNLHNPEYEICNRVLDKSASCEIIHDYEAAVIKHHGGPYNFSTCGSGCSDLWIGRVGDNYWGGYCSIYEAYTEVKIVNPSAITSAKLVRAKWDDYMQVWVGEPGKEVKVWQGPNNNFPPETGGRCELSTSWDRNPNVDLTRYFKNADPNSVMRFKIRVSVAGAGEGFGKIRVNYDPSQAVIRDEWSPQNCIESVDGLLDGFADGGYSCIDDPRDSSGCTYTNGIRICPSNLKPSPVPGVSNLCKRISVEADYNFYKGTLECYTDANGNNVCPENNGGYLDTCGELEDNPQCGFISSSCVEGAKGNSGDCYVQEEKWDCGSTVEASTIQKNTEYQCGGSIRCMGDDCLDPSQTSDQTGNFAKASALLNAAQFMTQDMTCTGLNEDGSATGDEDVTCSAFNGKAGECKIAVGGVADCCEKPSNISMVEYLAMIMQVPKLDGAVLALENENVIKSAYQTIRQPVANAWTETTNTFTNYMDNISGSVQEAFKPIGELKDELIEKLKEKSKEVLKDVLGSTAETTATDAAAAEATQEATETAANNAADTMASQGMSMLGSAMSVYSAYVAAVAVIQMVYACEEEEFEMNAKRAVDSCTYIGSYCADDILGVCIEKRESYCCFNSPLSRIIQEQVRPQFGQDFGSAKNPSCGGITLDKISQIDWDKINLDEWLAILKQNGQFPDEGISMDSLTGSGSVFNIDGDRLPADQRALERLDGVDVDEKRRDAVDSISIQAN
ncbi:conjugal transfer mating pair stabilization protein TraN [Marinomonas algarum]|uniref:Conjugal transfer mating pair stabilization protein TraN n=1 Tax=Marinomonas algarum TaxID=2883105 RepID=A0A9X1LFA3_9GAMM|nr:conjugal transfer mating pair stabilization protein TraN [Marinomonas algarum]MCB5162655.1 conjugal transfer mating pair stabilization protein TraN [Marinomonas algarum]